MNNYIPQFYVDETICSDIKINLTNLVIEWVLIINILVEYRDSTAQYIVILYQLKKMANVEYTSSWN